LALPRYRQSDLFTEREKTALDFAAGVMRTPVDVSDELFARMKQHFSDKQIVELTALLTVVNLDRFNAAFGIGSAGFSEGMVGVPPARPAAPGEVAGPAWGDNCFTSPDPGERICRAAGDTHAAMAAQISTSGPGDPEPVAGLSPPVAHAATGGAAKDAPVNMRLAILLAMAMFVLVVDTSLMNVSISAVIRDLHTTASGVQSAIALEALVSAAFILIGSKIGDFIGRKRAYVIGLLGYAVGALSMVLAQSLT